MISMFVIASCYLLVFNIHLMDLPFIYLSKINFEQMEQLSTHVHDRLENEPIILDIFVTSKPSFTFILFSHLGSSDYILIYAYPFISLTNRLERLPLTSRNRFGISASQAGHFQSSNLGLFFTDSAKNVAARYNRKIVKASTHPFSILWEFITSNKFVL